MSSQENVKNPPRHQTLSPRTRLGYVRLIISNLDRSLEFYQRSLGFQVHKRDGQTAYLGAGGEDLLILNELPGARRVLRTSGLYHFAILTPSRAALAGSLGNLIDTNTPLQGGADHLVSEAIYLPDPDGNGIEIYRDRPRSQWQYENGKIKMATDPLDYQGILQELNSRPSEWKGLDPGTTLGHMHLHVADLDQSTNFYERVLGFDFLINYMGSASFLSAGGYHHHIGLNTWNGVGAPAPPPHAVGLEYFMVILPDDGELTKLISRLASSNTPYEEREKGIFLRDPAQNGILFSVAKPVPHQD